MVLTVIESYNILFYYLLLKVVNGPLTLEPVQGIREFEIPTFHHLVRWREHLNNISM